MDQGDLHPEVMVLTILGCFDNSKSCPDHHTTRPLQHTQPEAAFENDLEAITGLEQNN